MNTVLCIASMHESLEKFKLTFDLIGVNSILTMSAREAMEIPPEQISMVLVNEMISDVSPFAVPQMMKIQNTAYEKIPFVLASYSTHPKILDFARTHGFSRIDTLPHNRRFLYSILRDLKIVDTKSLYGRINENDLFNIINDKKMISFLEFLLSKTGFSIDPGYDPRSTFGYCYPVVNSFFSVDNRDGNLILLRLFEHQAIERRLVNRIHLCPKCLYHTINFQEQCPKCSSIDFMTSDVIHHFSCGYVGEMSEFLHETNTQMICPKCNKMLRHIGMDYDKPAQMHKCNTCTYIFNDTKIGMQCFHCNYKGNSEEAVDYEIFSYFSNEKTVRMVEQKSFDASGLGINVAKDGFMCYNKQAFSFILWQKYLEAEEFGDALSVVMTDINKLNSDLLRSTIEYIAEIKRMPDIVCIDEAGKLLIMLPRVEDKVIIELTSKIRKFITTEKGSENIPLFFYVEKIIPRKHKFVTNILDKMYKSYENHYTESSEEPVFHEETFEEK